MLQDGSQSYLYGLSRIGQDDETDWLYYLTDALGSVKQLRDSSALLVNYANYSPYGVTSGMTETSYGYTGEFSSFDNLLHLRNRDYDSTQEYSCQKIHLWDHHIFLRVKMGSI
ncbi:MAG: hypothetical protein JEZ06_24325, partial [Anaerolineaceae bacterium]|nr:hypothetical protein [Anaerolineaceae bacterium]